MNAAAAASGGGGPGRAIARRAGPRAAGEPECWLERWNAVAAAGSRLSTLSRGTKDDAYRYTDAGDGGTRRRVGNRVGSSREGRTRSRPPAGCLPVQEDGRHRCGAPGPVCRHALGREMSSPGDDRAAGRGCGGADGSGEEAAGDNGAVLSDVHVGRPVGACTRFEFALGARRREACDDGTGARGGGGAGSDGGSEDGDARVRRRKRAAGAVALHVEHGGATSVADVGLQARGRGEGAGACADCI